MKDFVSAFAFSAGICAGVGVVWVGGILGLSLIQELIDRRSA